MDRQAVANAVVLVDTFGPALVLVGEQRAVRRSKGAVITDSANGER